MLKELQASKLAGKASEELIRLWQAEIERAINRRWPGKRTQPEEYYEDMTSDVMLVLLRTGLNCKDEFMQTERQAMAWVSTIIASAQINFIAREKQQR
jgi:hypothetical protein